MAAKSLATSVAAAVGVGAGADGVTYIALATPAAGAVARPPG